MMEAHLRERLKRVIARRQWYLAAWSVAATWAGVALLGALLYFIGRQTAWTSAATLPVLACAGLGVSVWLLFRQIEGKVDRKSTRLNSSHSQQSRMPSSA